MNMLSWRVGGVCLLLFVSGLPAAEAESAAQAPPQPPAVPAETSARDLFTTVGKSLILDSPVIVQRVSVANNTVAEAIVVSPREVLINGKAPGETSVIIWQQGGNRLIFDLKVRSGVRDPIEIVQEQLDQEIPESKVKLTLEDGNVFLQGTVNNLLQADRALRIATTLGRPVDLLRVKVPAAATQVLLKVRFADVDRAASSDFGFNLLSTGAANTVGSVSTGQFASGRVTPGAAGAATSFTLSDALNVFVFRPDLNLAATIKALQNRNLLQVLAEPNVLAMNGKSASFLAGGEFPYPTLQGGGGGLGQVTIAFREFGVRINFLPVITPRGTIRLEVTPEVSSLDYANGLVFQGFTVPGLATRRVQTEIELESGQSFAIGGLLDNRLTETFNKIPGLGDIPFLGKLFQSRTKSRNNTELLVLVTPELVRPIPANMKPPEIKMPEEFLPGTAKTAPRTPGIDVTGPVPVTPTDETIPVEQLRQSEKSATGPAPVPAYTPIQIVPVPVTPAPGAPPGQPAPATATPAQPAPNPPRGGASGAGGQA
jgi:pilus assembly protein CpaC